MLKPSRAALHFITRLLAPPLTSFTASLSQVAEGVYAS